MKRLLAVVAVILGAATVSAGAADVGVSVEVGEPGFYGRIEIGNFPRPKVIYSKPAVIRPHAVGVVRPPIYLRVPPGHAKHWDKHCSKYNACGEPVYFVQDRWYNEVYVPRYRESHGSGNDDHVNNRDKGHGQGHGKDKGRKDH